MIRGMQVKTTAGAVSLLVSELMACSPESPVELSTDQPVTDTAGNETTPAAPSRPTPSRPNILLVIGDDMGNETLSCFDIGRNPATTPSLDTLCNEGVRFSNFWSQPVCSPTRATILTGRYGFRTGVGDPTGEGEAVGPLPVPPAIPAAPYETPAGPPPGRIRPVNWGLPSGEYTLPRAFDNVGDRGYALAAIGKWHLADTRNGWLEHPNLVGFDHFFGLIRGYPESYFAWNKVIDGEVKGVTGYTADDKVADAHDWIAQQGERPWFLWFAFNLVHDPLHLPPEPLWRTDQSRLEPGTDPMQDPSAWFTAMLEALDSELENLLTGLSPVVRDNTYVIFLGDNGTESDWVGQPFRSGRAKGTVYQGGINVPLIITGPGVEKGELSEALVNSTDLFSTILEMAGIRIDQALPDGVLIDSVSLMPYLSDPGRDSIREWVYADTFETNFDGIEDGDYAIRNQRYKLLRHRGVVQFYDLEMDPYEYIDILERGMKGDEQEQYDALGRQVAKLRAGE